MSAMVHEQPCQGTMCFCSHRKSVASTAAQLAAVMAYATALRNALEASILKPSALPPLLFEVGRALTVVDELVPRSTSARLEPK